MEALRLADEALTLNPTNADAHEARAFSTAAVNCDAAIHSFTEAMRLRGGDQQSGCPPEAFVIGN